MLEYNRTSHEIDVKFRFPDVDNPYLSELRGIVGIRLGLDTNELEQVKTILGYAHNLFTHDGDSKPSSIDPITILREASGGKSFRCVEYCLLAVALLWAYGVTARRVGLKTSDVETRQYGASHIVIEYWSAEQEKWVMCDVQVGIIPKVGGQFLSALELGEAIGIGSDIEVETVDNSRFTHKNSFGDLQDYLDWVKEYLFFFDTPVEVTFANINLPKQLLVMLGPISIKQPIMFQNMFEMNLVYTNSVLDFYPRPAKNC